MKPISKWSVQLEAGTIGRESEFMIFLNGSISEGQSFFIPIMPHYEFFSALNETLSLSQREVPLMAVQDEESDLFRPIRMREECEFEFVLNVPLSKKEILERQSEPGNSLFPFNNLRLKSFVTFNNNRIWSEKDGYTLLSGRLQFKSFAGVVKFVFSEEISDQQVEVEIVTYKLNYEEDFRALLSNLADYHAELILQLDNPTEVALNIKQAENVSNQVLLLHFRKLMEKERIPSALENILSSPHTKIIHETNWDNPSLVANVDLLELENNYMDSLMHKGGALREVFQGYTPQLLPEETTVSTIDTQENRYVKFCLNELQFLVYTLRQKMSKTRFESSFLFLDSCERILDEYLQQPFFEEIGAFTYLTNSMVMQKRNGYKDLLQYMQQFEMGIQLESHVEELDVVNGDLRPIHQLYEYWCYFQLLYILEELTGQTSNIAESLIQSTEQGFSLNLKHRVECRVPFTYLGLEIFLYYNRDFKRSLENEWEGSYDGGIYHPDFSIRIRHKNQIHWLHFDSKYKIDYSKLKRMLREGQDKAAFKQNDIHTAHAYRDAILGSRGVYILYPDEVVLNKDFIFVRHPDSDYPYNIPSIGAFPLKPGVKYIEQIAEIKLYLKDIFDLLAEEENIYNEETGLNY